MGGAFDENIGEIRKGVLCDIMKILAFAVSGRGSRVDARQSLDDIQPVGLMRCNGCAVDLV